jgi:hypothetical protein
MADLCGAGRCFAARSGDAVPAVWLGPRQVLEVLRPFGSWTSGGRWLRDALTIAFQPIMDLRTPARRAARTPEIADLVRAAGSDETGEDDQSKETP